MELRKIAIDTKKASGGVWIPVGEDVKLLIARWDNPEFAKLIRSRVKRSSRSAFGSLEGSDADKELAELLSKTVLLGWEGLQLDGATLPYSREKAYEILTDPEFVDFRDLVVRLSQDSANFRAADLEEAAGNLPPTSGGGPNGDRTTAP